jgi:hypothetical protein
MPRRLDHRRRQTGPTPARAPSPRNEPLEFAPHTLHLRRNRLEPQQGSDLMAVQWLAIGGPAFGHQAHDLLILRRHHLGRQPLPPGMNNRPGSRCQRRGLTPSGVFRTSPPGLWFRATPRRPACGRSATRPTPTAPPPARLQLLHPPPGRPLPLLQLPQYRRHHIPPERHLHGRTGSTSPTPALCLTSTNPAPHTRFREAISLNPSCTQAETGIKSRTTPSVVIAGR